MEQVWRRLTQITNDEFEKLRLNFTICANHDVGPVKKLLVISCRPLQRMSAGMLLAACSFVMAAFIQIAIQVSSSTGTYRHILHSCVEFLLPSQ